MKPVGDWYVRKERRGLVCLVIDNRYAVEKLRMLENEELAPCSRLIANEPQVSFAEMLQTEGKKSGLSPSKTSFSKRQRGSSPDRKFVVSFASLLEDHSQEEQDERTNVLTPSQQKLAEKPLRDFCSNVRRRCSKFARFSWAQVYP